MNGQIKKIVLVIPSLTSGGMERVMSELANYFCNCPNTTVNLVILSKREHFYTIDSRVTIHEPDFTVAGFTGVFRLLSYLRKKVRIISPAAVLSFGEMFNSFTLLATIGLRAKIFVSDRSKPDRSWGAFHNLFRWIIYRRAYGIISQTELAKSIMFKRLGHKNIKVIGNPIKAVGYSEPAQRKQIVLTVGRMIKSKRHDRLIQMFAEVRQKGWQLHFVGVGPEHERLKNLVMQMGMQEDVVFWGNQKEIESFYQTAKIFAFTSNSEGFPNVLGEAMAGGLAPVCYDFVAGATDLVTNEQNGFIVPMDDDETFKKRLKDLMCNDDLSAKLATAAHLSIKKFHIQIIGEQYYQFLLN